MTDFTDVVVAFDGSPDAGRSLRWGARLAKERGGTLRVVIARGDLYSLSSWADEWTLGLATEWQEQAQKLLTDVGCENARIEIRDGLPAPVLVVESGTAGTVVLGSGGHGRIGGVVLGSVSQHVARHAACPVVVVRPAYDESSRRVYVGVDGSAPSLAALECAVDYAECRGGREVVALVCWEPFLGASDEHYDELAAGIAVELERELDVVRAAAEAACARHPGVDVAVQVDPQRASRALTDASQHAELVVVGSRGRGAFAGLLLGSVSAAVARDARCPVMVVRGRDDFG